MWSARQTRKAEHCVISVSETCVAHAVLTCDGALGVTVEEKIFSDGILFVFSR